MLLFIQKRCCASSAPRSSECNEVYRYDDAGNMSKKLGIIFMVITLIGGGFALLIGGRLTAPTSASHTDALISSGDLSVVGPPSLPATTVDAIFSRLGSPMAGTGKLVEQTSRQAHIDDAFALAVWWRETNDGET